MPHPPSAIRPIHTSASVQVEQILAVPRSIFDNVGAFQGLRFDIAPYLSAFFNPANNLFLPRPDAERDPSYKQIIPYAVIACGDEILHYRRGGGSGEKRLAARESVGLGGHLNPSDQKHLDTGAYETLVLRELAEEIDMPSPVSNRIVAILNDDSSEVGKVHIGLVHLIRISAPRVVSRETDIEEPSFRSIGEIRARFDRLEGWSQIVIENIGRLLDADR